jgi:UDP-glucose:(heptosyl)LPS alpha-1,3-glucosyltransferase
MQRKRAPMKIAIVRKKYSFHGGAERFSHSLVKRLAGEHYDIHIFAIKWDAEDLPHNIHFHSIKAPTFNSLVRDLFFVLLTYIKISKDEFDIIQTHDKTLMQDIYRAGDGCHREWIRQRWKRVGMLKKLSIILNPYHWFILILEWMIFKGHRFKKVIAISEFVKRNIVENYGVKKTDIDVIYNGVDLDKFTPSNRDMYRGEIRKRHSIERDETVALFVGSGFERKGVGYLLEAVSGLSDHITVLIVGKGTTRRFGKYLGKQKIIFCGPRKDIEKYYAAADLFVFPTMYEPFGNVHLEALASGLPVITTALSGGSEAIEDGKDGFVVDRPENMDMMRAAIRKLLDGDKRKEMSVNARKKAETFSIDRHISETLRLYSKVRDDKR